MYMHTRPASYLCLFTCSVLENMVVFKVLLRLPSEFQNEPTSDAYFTLMCSSCSVLCHSYMLFPLLWATIDIVISNMLSNMVVSLINNNGKTDVWQPWSWKLDLSKGLMRLGARNNERPSSELNAKEGSILSLIELEPVTVVRWEKGLHR